MRAENRVAKPVKVVFRPPAARWTSPWLATAAAPPEEVEEDVSPPPPLGVDVAG